MSFNIILQRSNSEPIRMDKNLSVIANYTGTLREGTSIIDPIIKIECDISDVRNCNYLTVPAFSRSYFVKDIRSVTSDIVEFTCHVDVLTTYATDIRKNRGIIKRQENLWNLYLNDGSLKIYQNPQVITKEFPSGFNDMRFVLGVAGS
jgi:hypothetical protein